MSSDLSHFHSDELAREVDQRTINYILQHDDKHITTEEACGAIAIRGFLKHDNAKHYRARLLACANSGKDPKKWTQFKLHLPAPIQPHLAL